MGNYRQIRYVSGIFFSALVVLFQGKAASAQPIRVAVSANAANVARMLALRFGQHTGIQSELIIGSSGKLTSQMLHGAPFDVFLSADMKYPEQLYQRHLTTAAPRIYAHGQLVLWVNKNIEGSSVLAALQHPQVKRIAVANPALAPYGTAAIAALRRLSLLEKIKSKIVYGESIAQVNQYFLSGVVEAAFTASPVMSDPGNQSKGRWYVLNSSWYPPIAQGAVILKSASRRNQRGAAMFYQFLYSTEAKKIFKQFGYR